MTKKALIVVDVQNDFLPPNGSLAVPEGNEIISGINNIRRYFDDVIFTRDYHPQKHISFASTHNVKPFTMIAIKGKNQMVWPDHCIQNEKGCLPSEELYIDVADKMTYKGMKENVDSYSGFFDDDGCVAYKLDDFLKEDGIKDIYLVGLATDYCVKATAIDGARLGYNVTVILNLCRGVAVETTNKAIIEMKNEGVNVIKEFVV